MGYKLQESEKPNYWVCTDIDNGIVCIFENQNFNDNQAFTFLEDIEKPNASELAKIVNQMAEWLKNNHYCKILPCDIRLRIGRRIAELRMERGYSLMQLAEMTGLDNSNISKIEHGRYNVGVDLLDKITTALNCKLDIVELTTKPCIKEIHN